MKKLTVLLILLLTAHCSLLTANASQNALVVPDGSGAQVRAGFNNALDTLNTVNCGPAAPATTEAYMLWADTANNLLKQRDAANATWIILGTLGVAQMGHEPAITPGATSQYWRGDKTWQTLPLGTAAGYFSRLKVYNDAATPATKMDITADSVALTDGTNYTQCTGVNLGIACVSNGANGLDTGSLSNGNWYYFYVIYGTNGTAGLASLSATAPAMPSGYTQKKLVSAVYYTSGAFATIQQYNRIIYNLSNPTTITFNYSSLTAVSLSAYVPSNAVAAQILLSSAAGVAINMNIAWTSGGINQIPFSLPQVYGNVPPFWYCLNPAAPQTIYVSTVAGGSNTVALSAYELDI